MTSPYVLKTIALIDKSSNPQYRACLAADLACYWARVGEFDEAERLKLAVRAAFGKGEDLEVSVRLLCLDALLLFYKGSDPQSRDRMLRAHLLSTASGRRPLIAHTSSILAMLDFNYNSIDSMLDNIRLTFSSLSASDQVAECRISLVLAGLFLFFGEKCDSDVWHEKTRRLAVELGDQATIGALLYNRAVYKVIKARLEGIDNTGDLADLRIDIQNAVNYQDVAQVRSLNHWLELLQISFLMLNRNLEEALVKMQAILASKALPSTSAQYYVLIADMIYCLSKAGRVHEASLKIGLLDDFKAEHFSIDENALVCRIMASVARESGVAGADAWLQLEQTRMKAYRDYCQDLASKLVVFR